jgi:hypothetical protein
MAFQAIHVMNAPHIFFGGMIDRAVIVGVTQAMIGAMLVRADRAARFDVLVDDAFDRVSRHIRNRCGDNLAVAL